MRPRHPLLEERNYRRTPKPASQMSQILVWLPGSLWGVSVSLRCPAMCSPRVWLASPEAHSVEVGPPRPLRRLQKISSAFSLIHCLTLALNVPPPCSSSLSITPPLPPPPSPPLVPSCSKSPFPSPFASLLHPSPAPFPCPAPLSSLASIPPRPASHSEPLLAVAPIHLRLGGQRLRIHRGATGALECRPPPPRSHPWTAEKNRAGFLVDRGFGG